MKQIIQNLKTGATILEEVPAPMVRKGHVLIRTHRSLVSLGTEKMLVEFGKSNLISKARQQPEKVKQVLDKIKTDGLLPTLEAVFNKLDEPLPLGYCNAGEVVQVGDGVTEFKVGDRVISNGHHAEYVSVPKNLCARIPDNVTYDEASFTVIASIGLQGIRLVNPTLGETVVVIGLGLIGLITAELLVANGCEVIGFDFDEKKLQLAREKGIKAFTPENQLQVVESLSNGIGADAVIITASTKSNDVIKQAANMSRKRGRIVLVGVVGLNIDRTDFFKKELSFQVSCSYGPGRYDEDYEGRGIDYPLSFVRWTEQRNFKAILTAIANKKLNVLPLITEQVALEDYMQVYGNMGGGSIASVLVYGGLKEETTKSQSSQKSTKGGDNAGVDWLENDIKGLNAMDAMKHNKNGELHTETQKAASNTAEITAPPRDVFSNVVKLKDISFEGKKGVIGIIGAGNFTKMTMLPALKGTGAGLKYMASAGGVSGTALAKKYGFSYSTTDVNEVLKDEDVDLVMITTRHNMHAGITIKALEAGKHVFVEKPLAITEEQLHSITEAYERTDGLTVSVGFNRRFSPFIQKAKNLLGDDNAPFNMIATMNAGHIPADVWVHDLQVGGGRIVGEACHFIDLMVFLCESKVESVFMSALGKHPEENTDNAIITLHFKNGSQGVINYFANGSKSYAKERIEIYTGGRTLVVDNFRKLEGFGFKSFTRMRGSQDKGHKSQFKLLIENVKNGGDSLIPFDELVNVTEASFAAMKSLKDNQVVYLKNTEPQRPGDRKIHKEER